MWCFPMRITAIVEAVLVAGALLAAGPARAEVTALPTLSHFYPLQPPPGLPADPMAEADELSRQISDLDASWDGLTPEQRNQRIAGLQQQVTKVDLDTRNLPQDQKAGVDAILLPSILHLADLLGKVQTPPQGPCVFPLCLPGL
jgi:hypothetical protein